MPILIAPAADADGICVDPDWKLSGAAEARKSWLVILGLAAAGLLAG